MTTPALFGKNVPAGRTMVCFVVDSRDAFDRLGKARKRKLIPYPLSLTTIEVSPMKQYSYSISDLSELGHVIDDVTHLSPKGQVLISLFTPWCAAEIATLTKRLASAFPQASLSGMTSIAGISHGRNADRRTVILFDIFERAEVHTYSYEVTQGTEKENGIRFLSALSHLPHVAGIEILTSQDEKGFSDFQPFLACLDTLDPELPVWGAIADSETWPKDTYVFTKDFLSHSGYVLRVYTGDVEIMTDHVFGFQPLSRKLTITAMDGPMIIKELDHKPAVYFYDRYIHVRDFLEQSLPFPLIHTNHGGTHAHLPQGRTEDGGIIFNISTKVGEKMQVSYGAPETMMEETRTLWEKLIDFEPDGLHALSCIARFLYLQQNLNDVLRNYSAIAPIHGVYGHGEIYRSGTRLIGAHLTGCITAFREGNKKGKPRPCLPPVHLSSELQHLLQMASFIRTAMTELNATQDALRIAATHDSLTGLLNRRALEKELARCIESAKNKGGLVSAIMIDLDQFKEINDTYGHEAGDQAIICMADIMKRNTPPAGAACRWGGDEFVVLLPGANMAAAVDTALSMKRDLTSQDTLSMTASFGITTSRFNESRQSFAKRIDNALYISKGRGRNRITTIDPMGVIESVIER